MQKMEDEVKDLEEDERWSREMPEKGNIREREGKPVEEEEGRKEGSTMICGSFPETIIFP